MLGVSQGCISKILRGNRETVDNIRGSVEVQWKSPCHGKTVNCSKWSELTASSRLLVCECRWSADFFGGWGWGWGLGLGLGLGGGGGGRGVGWGWLGGGDVSSNHSETASAGYLSSRPAKCLRITLEHRRRRRLWGRRHRVWDLR